MAAKLTAGILVYRIRDNVLQVMLAHAGGPFWAKKDDGAWSIIKGEPQGGEDLFAAAKREFTEETGQAYPENAHAVFLGVNKLSSGKTGHVWAIEQDYDPRDIRSNTFEMEWPPRSGQMQEFPENDRVEWFYAAEAPRKMFKGQAVFVERLAANLREQNATLILKTPENDDRAQPSLF